MPYGDLQAIHEGYLIRTQKVDANFRSIGWLLVCSFSEKKDRPKTEQAWWPLQIDQIGRKATRKAKIIPKKNRIKQTDWQIFINRMK